jgi:predicted CoA-substrate-specific enzyme activase
MDECIEETISKVGTSFDKIEKIVATGYGRVSCKIAHKEISEITCHGKGAYFSMPGARTIIDIGGQDSKVISSDEFGNAIDFALNDRCAAGTGRFLEVMARALDMSLDDLGDAASTAADVLPISCTCTVFAESEVVGLVSLGHPRDCIAAGLCVAIARQIVTLAARLGLEQPVALVGGVARNAGVRYALSHQLSHEPLVPDHPQFTAALGAALVAQEVLSQS